MTRADLARHTGLARSTVAQRVDALLAGGLVLEADDLVGYAILHRAIRTFQEEGKAILSFGLSPLSGIEDGGLSGSRLLRSASA